jgi:Na+/H+ antiporter NhaC
MIPIAVPTALLMNLALPLPVAAVLSGSVFGDHCSPISDTTMVSSMASASDHIDHVRTQIPYALTAAAGAVMLFTLFGLLLN